ncbi:MAG: hypothetical protein LBD53_06690 [Tannerella sp.]|nr:hypothetical protein [Tannerella sp.]
MTWYFLLSAFCKPLAGFKTTARVWGTVIHYRGIIMPLYSNDYQKTCCRT